MKTIVHGLFNGDLRIELVSETELEYAILDKAWSLNGYLKGMGDSLSPKGAKTGFYLPLFNTSKSVYKKADE